MTPQEFQAAWATWDINQRYDWMRFAAQLQGRQVTQAELDTVRTDWVAQHFGALSAYLDHPELGPILNQAADQGWTPERLQVAISQTQWWKTHDASQRQFEELQRTDPAEAADKVSKQEQQIRTLLAQEGATLSDARITALATAQVANGVATNDVPRQVLAEIQYDPNRASGALTSQQQSVKARSEGDWLLPMSDEAAFSWAKQIEMGQATQAGVDAYMKNVAMATYGQNDNIKTALEQGSTMKVIMDPYTQAASQLLEKSPAEINWMDPTLQRVINHQDTNGTRMMSIPEAQTYLRQTDEFAHTQQANQGVAELQQGIAQKMGMVA